MEFTFEETPWSEALSQLKAGDTMDALHFLTLMEGEEEDAVEDAFEELLEKGVALSLEQLPALGASGASAVRLKQEAGFTKTGQILSGLEENDPLRLYLEELAGIPAAGDVALLAQRLLEGENVAEQIVNLCLSRVVEESLTMTGRGVLLLDLIQEGSLGLWQSTLHYAGGDFEQHCQWWIRQYMAKAVVLHCRNSGLGQKLRQGMEDYLDVDQRLLTDLGRNPTLEEIAQELHVTLPEAEMFEKMVSDARILANAHKDSQPQEPEPEDDQAVEDTAYFQSRQRIMELLSTLDAQEAQLLTLRFGLEGSLPLSPQQTAARLRMSPEEVVIREEQALAKLRQNQD